MFNSLQCCSVLFSLKRFVILKCQSNTQLEKLLEWSGLNVIFYIISTWKTVFFNNLPCSNSQSEKFSNENLFLSSTSFNEMEVHTQLS